MRKLTLSLTLCLLLCGCNRLKKEVTGNYKISRGEVSATLELHGDSTYRQEIRLPGQVWVTATGKWTAGDSAKGTHCSYQCVFLEKAFEIQDCPTVKGNDGRTHACKTVYGDVVALSVKKGGPSLGLVDDELADIIYYKQ
jgi:hypothetical protein